jgi:hypothetical protein
MLVLESLKRVVKSSRLLRRMAAPLYRELVIRMSRRPLKGDIPIFGENTRLPIVKLRSFDEYQTWKAENSSELERRRAVEAALISSGGKASSIPGTCALCGRETAFEYNYAFTVAGPDGRPIPNLRELLFCRHCGLRNRVRAAIQLFIQEFNPGADQSIYITEQFGPVYRWLKGRFANTFGSEYLSADIPFGSSVRGIRNEDLGALTWPDERFDYIVSLDVLEHVADENACFSQIYRCLRHGGRFLFMAPFNAELREMFVMAKREPDGKITHFCEPEYHGNPTDPVQGSLCMRYFAWDILEQMKRIGFNDAQAWLFWSKELGYLGGTLIAVSAGKE